MTALVCRVGIVGANAQRGWARDAHLPSLQCVPEFSIQAVSARTQDQAEAARQVFGAAEAFGDSLDLVRSPSVDLVVVTVRVPDHRALVLAALAAGKNVFCEWPLGRDLAETEAMAAAVPAAAHVMIGLQALSSPATRRARELISSGAIGRLKVLRVYSPSIGWGAEAPPFYAYLQDKTNGATLETVAGGHTLSLIEALAGPYVAVDARNSILRSRVRVQSAEGFVERTCADHMLVIGLHQGGCVSTIEVVGGVENRPFTLELEGEDGWIRLSGGARGKCPPDCQAGALELETSLSGPVPLEPAAPDLKGAAINVSESYVRLADDLRTGERTVPDFQTAIRLNRLIAAIEKASRLGRQNLEPPTS